MAEEEDRSEKLSREDGDALRNLLLYLRYVMRHKFVAIAQKSGVRQEVIFTITSGRSRGTKFVQERIYEYARERRVPIEIATGLGANHGFRSELNISDETLTKDAIALAGRYLLYTLLSMEPTERVGVTLVTLYPKEEGDSLPEFSGWRPETRAEAVQHKGFYYLYEGGLYLVGHTTSTGYPRMTCVKSAGEAGDFVGTVTAATHDDLSFQSWCYLKKTPKSLRALRREEFKMLGIFDLPDLEKAEPEIPQALHGKPIQRVPRSRPSTSPG